MQRHAQWQQKRIHPLSHTRRFFAAFSLRTPPPTPPTPHLNTPLPYTTHHPRNMKCL
jgi:hypothetical protein